MNQKKDEQICAFHDGVECKANKALPGWVFKIFAGSVVTVGLFAFGFLASGISGQASRVDQYVELLGRIDAKVDLILGHLK